MDNRERAVRELAFKGWWARLATGQIKNRRYETFATLEIAEEAFYAGIELGEARAAIEGGAESAKRCSVCGAERSQLDRAGTQFGACKNVYCEFPLKDFDDEKALRERVLEAPPREPDQAVLPDDLKTDILRFNPNERSFGWNIEQILVYIWQCMSGGDDEEAHPWPFSTFSNSPMAARLRLEMKALAARAEAPLAGAGLREALEQSILAIDDWLNIYAADQCDEERVTEAFERVRDQGGTLSYISKVQQQNRAALAAPRPPKEGV